MPSLIKKSWTVTIVRFPKVTIDSERAKRWAELMCRQNFAVKDITQNTVVCELHFPINANLNYRENEDLVPYPHGHKRAERRVRERSPEVETPFPSGGFETAIKLKKEDCIYTTISRRYTIAEWLEFAGDNKNLVPKVMVSSNDFGYLKSVLRSVPELKYIHLPTDHMFTQDFEAFIKKIRRNFPTHGITIGSLNKVSDNHVRSYSRETKQKAIRFEIPVNLQPVKESADINEQPGNFLPLYNIYYDKFLFLLKSTQTRLNKVYVVHRRCKILSKKVYFF